MHRPAVLLVTHDVDEAIRLADRVLVMGDGAIEHDERVELRRPRSIDPPATRRCGTACSIASASRGRLMTRRPRHEHDRP